MPLIETWRETGRKEFLETAVASGEFTLRAMRQDGGYIRGTYLDEATGEIRTDAFGHATSGSTCAAILFLELGEATGEFRWREAAEKPHASPAVGYFSNDRFDPAKYKTQLPYDAFRMVTKADGFWAARIIMTVSGAGRASAAATGPCIGSHATI